MYKIERVDSTGRGSFFINTFSKTTPTLLITLYIITIYETLAGY